MTQELPPLPEPEAWSPGSSIRVTHYTADQMRAYALQAIAARADAPRDDHFPDAGKMVARADAQPVAVEYPDDGELETWRATADDLLRSSQPNSWTLRKAAHLLQNAYLFVSKAKDAAPAPRQPLSDDSILVDGVAMEPLSQLKDCVSIFTAGVRFAERAHGITEDTCPKT